MLLTIMLISIVSLTLFGIGDYAIGRGGRAVNPFVANFIIQLMAFAPIAPLALALGLTWHELQATLPALFIGLVFGAGFFFYVKAMARGPIGIAAPLLNTYAMVALLVSLAFFGVVLSGTITAALGIVAIGILLLTFTKDLLKGKLLYSGTAKLAGVAAIIMGSSFAFLTPIIQEHAWHVVLFQMSLGTLIATTILMLAKAGRHNGELRAIFSNRAHAAMLGGLFTGLGAIALYIAGGLGGNIVLPVVITAASPLVTSVMAYMIDKEHIPLINRIGAAVVVAGMVLMNL